MCPVVELRFKEGSQQMIKVEKVVLNNVLEGLGKMWQMSVEYTDLKFRNSSWGFLKCSMIRQQLF